LDDRAVGPSDFDIGTVTVPVDPRLPDGGGGTLSFYDLKPTSVRVPDELRTHAGNFGGETEHWDGFDLTVDARVADLLLQGGLSTGRRFRNYCDIQAQLPETLERGGIPERAPSGNTAPLEYCNRGENWLTQVKFLGSYTLPGDVHVAATLQNQPGPERVAEVRYIAADTSLGRPLTLFPSAVTLNVIEPGSFYGERFNQLDLRVTKIFNLGGFGRFRAMFDIYNVFNANTVTKEQPSYGPQWLAPQAIVPGRLGKFAFQVDF
jgi:hypothetical protein